MVCEQEHTNIYALPIIEFATPMIQEKNIYSKKYLLVNSRYEVLKTRQRKLIKTDMFGLQDYSTEYFSYFTKLTAGIGCTSIATFAVFHT